MSKSHRVSHLPYKNGQVQALNCKSKHVTKLDFPEKKTKFYYNKYWFKY